MYSIVFTKKAIASFLMLPKNIQVLVVAKLKFVAQDPYKKNHALKRMKGDLNYYRLRQGDYRVLYSVESESKKLEVITVAHRKKVYV